MDATISSHSPSAPRPLPGVRKLHMTWTRTGAIVRRLRGAYGMIDLHSELLRAIRVVRDPRVEPDFAHLGFTPRVQWGFARVAFYGLDHEFYEPAEDGPSMAFIVPIVEGGETIDLAAIDGVTQHVATRQGLGHALGLDAIEKARFRCCDLLLVDRPLVWLKNPVEYPDDWPRDPITIEAVYLFNLREARVILEGLDITCNTIELHDRVRSLLPPSQRQRVAVRG